MSDPAFNRDARSCNLYVHHEGEASRPQSMYLQSVYPLALDAARKGTCLGFAYEKERGSDDKIRDTE